MASLLGLDELEAKGRQSTKPSLLTEDEWREVWQARERSVAWSDIYQKVGRFKTLAAFQAAYYHWRHRA